MPVEVGVAEEEQEEDEGRVGLELSSNDITVKSLSEMVPRGLERGGEREGGRGGEGEGEGEGRRGGREREREGEGERERERGGEREGKGGRGRERERERGGGEIICIISLTILR